MSDLTYIEAEPHEKPLVRLHGEIRSPPFSRKGRIEAGYLLRLLQNGAPLGMPHSRPMPVIGKACHELRINDYEKIWRIFYRVDPDAIVILDVVEKKTAKTPQRTIDVCKNRLASYDGLRGG
jgi:phage-related protein